VMVAGRYERVRRHESPISLSDYHSMLHPKCILQVAHLGHGAYSRVFSARDVITNEQVAIKDVIFHNPNEGVPSTSIREVSILKALQHPNIVALRDVVHENINDTESLTLILEFVQYDLLQYLEHSAYGVDVCKNCFRQFLRAVAHVHGAKIMHRDLKPQNILVHADGTLKLCDFGLAREFGIPSDVRTQEVVTLWYRAPEILLGWKNYTYASDIWSIGCILAEMWNRRTLFAGDSEIDQLHRIFRVCGTPHEEVWSGCSSLPNYRGSFPAWDPLPWQEIVPNLGPQGCDLLQKLLVFEPGQRQDARDAQHHPFLLEEVPDDATETATSNSASNEQLVNDTAESADTSADTAASADTATSADV